MHATSTFVSLLSMAAAASAAAFPHMRRAGTTANGTTVVNANWDGSCFYPIPVSTFDVSTYVGVWYQVAGYTAIFDAACKCITANYTLNDDGTVGVVNTCQSLDLPVSITGSAAAADAAYGDAGVFSVTLAGSDGLCPGPNYIVQEYVEGDYAIVQSPDFATLFILSRVQNVTTEKLDTLISRAVDLGSVEDDIVIDDQTGCLYT